METTYSQFKMRTIALHLTRNMSMRTPEEKQGTLGICGVAEVLSGGIGMMRCFFSKGKAKHVTYSLRSTERLIRDGARKGQKGDILESIKKKSLWSNLNTRTGSKKWTDCSVGNVLLLVAAAVPLPVHGVVAIAICQPTRQRVDGDLLEGSDNA